MSAERIVIVGAGPAGLATARAYREHGGRGSVTLISDESLPPYRRPPLTKELLRREIDAAELPLEQIEWFRAHDVQLKLRAKASAIDLSKSTVTVNEAALPADAIVLATGSEPVRADLPGMNSTEVMTVRTLFDSVRVSMVAREGVPMVVIGSGFIGCEIAGSLAMRGARVTMVGQESLPLLRRLGPDAGRAIAGWLETLGVRLLSDATVRAVHEGRVVELADGSQAEGSCVVLGMGASPRGELGAQAGLELSDDGAIVVDERMRTEHSVYAVGDVAHALNSRAERHLRVEHWGEALIHGQIAGRTLAGKEASWDHVPGFWSTIGPHTVKYAAWGDGYEQARLVSHPNGGFTVWYSRDGVAVGVLTHECDADYERGRQLIAEHRPTP